MNKNIFTLITLLILSSCSYKNVIVQVSFTNNYFEALHDIVIGDNNIATLKTGEKIENIELANGSYEICCTSESNLQFSSKIKIDEHSGASLSIIINENGKFLLSE